MSFVLEIFDAFVRVFFSPIVVLSLTAVVQQLSLVLHKLLQP